MFKKFSLADIIIDFVEMLIIATLVALLCYFFIAKFLVVSGDSMKPTILNGEQLLSESVSLKFKDLERGEIVVFKHPKEGIMVVKRAVGLPGEKIELDKGRIFINGKALSEPYIGVIDETKPLSFLKENSPVIIPADNYFVMGDNRAESTDSREWGFLEKSYIEGRVLLVFYPLNSFRIISALLR